MLTTLIISFSALGLIEIGTSMANPYVPFCQSVCI